MKRLLVAALALACALAGPTFAATRQADPASLRSVYDAAAPGDTIQLATGAYGDVSFATYPQSKVFAAPGVVIMPAPGAKPVFSSVNLSNGAGGVTLQDFEVSSTGSGSAVAIAHGDAPKPGGEVHLKRMKIHGPDRADHAYTGSGVFVRGDGPGVSIEDSEISNFGLGVGIMDSVGVTLSGSHIHHVQVDAIDINGSADVIIDNNDFDHFYAAVGDHPDAIQSWGTADHPRVSNLSVTHNRIVGSSPTFPPQGIFLDSVDNAKVQGNALVGTLYNGISLSDSRGALIDGNFLQSAPWGGDASTFTRIIVRGQSSDVTVSNNLASSWGQYQDGGQPNPNYVESGNTVVAATTRAADGTPNTADFLAWIAAQGQTAPPVVIPPPVVVDPPPVVTPPPIVVPPVNPPQVAVDSLNAQVASLTAKVASLTAQLQTATALTSSQASQIATLKAQLAAATTKITKGRSALK